MSVPQKIWFVSEVYFPDEQGTAFYTTGLAEGLAREYQVGVLCSEPTVTARGVKVAAEELRNGVRIIRCKGTTYDKDSLVLRLVNMLTFSFDLLVKGLLFIKPGDIVVAVTSPPSVPFISQLVCKLRGARCLLRLEDVYPEAMVATGLISRQGILNRVLTFMNRLLYRSVDQITVLGRDMKTLALKKTAGNGSNIAVIRSWADTDVVQPLPREQNLLLARLGIADKFVVSCVGNMGRAQAVESILEAASLLRENKSIHFLFIGSGAKKAWLEREVAKRRLENVSLLGQLPRSEQSVFLNACDISVISLLPGMTGAGVPSRTYNIMAAGKPIIALTSRESEVALLVNEEKLGWVVEPERFGDLVVTILDARSRPNELLVMGCRARELACNRFSREQVINEYRHLIKSNFETEDNFCHAGVKTSLKKC